MAEFRQTMILKQLCVSVLVAGLLPMGGANSTEVGVEGTSVQCGAAHGIEGLHVYLHTRGRWRDHVGGRQSEILLPSSPRVEENHAFLNDFLTKFSSEFPSEVRDVDG